MIALDTNLLVYAHRADMPEHEAARAVVDGLLGGAQAVGLCWPVAHEFLAVVTNGRVFRDPTPAADAFAQLEHWMSSPRVSMLCESGSHLTTLEALVIGGRATGAALHDARIAAICIDHGVSELLTADRDFSRFPTVRVRNPLVRV